MHHSKPILSLATRPRNEVPPATGAASKGRGNQPSRRLSLERVGVTILIMIWVFILLHYTSRMKGPKKFRSFFPSKFVSLIVQKHEPKKTLCLHKSTYKYAFRHNLRLHTYELECNPKYSLHLEKDIANLSRYARIKVYVHIYPSLLLNWSWWWSHFLYIFWIPTLPLIT
jgi:hypothetical protein